jgi:hypothetical protein
MINKRPMQRTTSTDNIRKLQPFHPSVILYDYQIQNHKKVVGSEKPWESFTQQHKLYSEKCIIPSKMFGDSESVHPQSMKMIINNQSVKASMKNIPYMLPFDVNRPVSQPKPPKQTRMKTSSV